MIWFIVVYLIPLFIMIFGSYSGTTGTAILSVALIGEIGMFSLEIMTMVVDGPSVYFKDVWNLLDCFNLLMFLALYIIGLRKNSSLAIQRTPSDTDNVIKILECAVILISWLKITWYQKRWKNFGLMQTLLTGVFAAILPFLGIYLFWVSFFALMAATLGANKTLAEAYIGLTPAVGWFLNTFENSIGNINAPSIDFSTKDLKKFDNVIVSLIYFFWWSGELVLLVVMLNFLIALISQYYEDVMNSAIMHTYAMRYELNHEYHVFK